MTFDLEAYLTKQAVRSLEERFCLYCLRAAPEYTWTVVIRRWNQVPVHSLEVEAAWCFRHGYKLWIHTMAGIERMY